MQGSPGPKRAFTATVPQPQAHPYLKPNRWNSALDSLMSREVSARYLNKSSKAFRALVGAWDLVSRSTVVRGS